jgi:pilus assembly protein CpaE
MSRTLKVLLAGRSKEALEALVADLAGAPGLACATRLIGNGHIDPLAGVQPVPDVLVLRFGAGNLAELAKLAESGADSRPPLIVVGPAGNPEAARLAVRSGARDFLVEPVNPQELIAALEALREQPRRGGADPRRAEFTVVLGAAGGVGTSFVACNLAHAIATDTVAPTLLVDLDLNGAPLASFLDLTPARGLLPALAEVEYLDEHALQGYVTRHRSGLHLMGAPSQSLVSLRDLDPSRCAALLEVVAANYRHVVVDASRGLDDLALAGLGLAKHVLVVVQQSVVQLKLAARLLRVLHTEVGIADDRIRVVANRHLKRATVSLDDIKRTLAQDTVTVLPNQYQTVLSSLDGGIPVLELDKSSAVAKAVAALHRELSGAPVAERTGLLRRALPIFSGG